MGQVVSTSLQTVSHYVFPEHLPKAMSFTKLTEKGISPTRGSNGAAGYDLYAAYELEIPAQGKALIKTDIAIAIPEGWYGRVAPRLGKLLVILLNFSWQSHVVVQSILLFI